MNLISSLKRFGWGLLAATSILWLVPGPSSKNWNLKAFAQESRSYTNRDLMLDMHNVAKTSKAYYKKHNHLPMQPREQDELLHILYKQSTEYNPDVPLPMPSSHGPYRTIGRFRIEYNLSINQNSNTLILWRRTPPATWNGPAGSIGIVSNGGDRLLLYAVGNGGTPIKSDNGLTIFFTYDFKEGTSDERYF